MRGKVLQTPLYSISYRSGHNLRGKVLRTPLHVRSIKCGNWRNIRTSVEESRIAGEACAAMTCRRPYVNYNQSMMEAGGDCVVKFRWGELGR
jgi:hypothetical protein